jgi:hypothetical protein
MIKMIQLRKNQIKSLWGGKLKTVHKKTTIIWSTLTVIHSKLKPLSPKKLEASQELSYTVKKTATQKTNSIKI